ncbi:hypothetical protein [Jannaschia marina]|uniref:hypothetical protein n=1 Tax=Jannaschia marina TaxID=2741674 RepID=UPI0015CB1B72|nr:hypothetical protein [Jannaschia marina]
MTEFAFDTRLETKALRVTFVGSAHVHTPDCLAVCDRMPWIEVVGIVEPDAATAHMIPADLLIFKLYNLLHAICLTLTAQLLFIEKPLAVNGMRAAALADRMDSSEKAGLPRMSPPERRQ